jgi:hypothetical protein
MILQKHWELFHPRPLTFEIFFSIAGLHHHLASRQGETKIRVHDLRMKSEKGNIFATSLP